ncbi:hypothetical protein Gotri_011677 [Gossypium trilobum]|uniref:Uncharacterized protein n=1 Tax=Gossypium trilobum TaxID=34281 RepID=A0A7J9EV36_9ROSI|nr:hypothetical protein [Gossypium trilobum]
MENEMAGLRIREEEDEMLQVEGVFEDQKSMMARLRILRGRKGKELGISEVLDFTEKGNERLLAY